MNCRLNVEGETVFEIDDEDVDMFMDVVNPEYKNQKKVYKSKKLQEMFPDNHETVITSYVQMFNDFSNLCELQGEEHPHLERQLIMRNLDINTNYNDDKDEDTILEQAKIMNKDKTDNKDKADF